MKPKYKIDEEVFLVRMPIKQGIVSEAMAGDSIVLYKLKDELGLYAEGDLVKTKQEAMDILF